MNPCKLREPKVIDNALLEKCVVEQGPTGEAGRLAEIEKVPLEEVTQIRLEFMNILKIDHLWLLKSLTKLHLNNNLIEKIENLECLIHLVELNLSFNKISKIENLDAFMHLERLSLFDNKIEFLENMDSLSKLTIFSIGRNKIDDIDNLLYLRRFPNLKSLNLAGNPCTETDDFRLFIAVFLPQVVYYEYKLIYDLERELGNETFGARLRSLMEIEEKDANQRQKEEQAKKDAKLHALSFVEYLNTNHLFDSLFANDSDGRNLLYIGEDAKEFYEEFQDQFIDLCKHIFTAGQEQYHIRQEEHEQFINCEKEAKKKNQDVGIEHMEAFLKKKALVFYDLKVLQNKLDMNEVTYEEFIDNCDIFVTDYDAMLHDVWKVLMKLELELHEQIVDVNQTFEHAMTDLINNFVEVAQGFFSQIRDLESTYSENMIELASKYQASAMNQEIVVPQSLKELMTDKDLLHNSLATSHDMHLQIIDGREDLLIIKANKWLEELVDSLTQNEIKRNREKVLEINHFLDIQREEFEVLNAEYVTNAEPNTTNVDL